MGSLLDDQDLTLEGPILHRSDHETKYIENGPQKAVDIKE